MRKEITYKLNPSSLEGITSETENKNERKSYGGILPIRAYQMGGNWYLFYRGQFVDATSDKGKMIENMTYLMLQERISRKP